MTSVPSVSISGKEYFFSNLTSTAYLRLAVIMKPLDGTSLADLTLDDPDTLTDPSLKAKAIADRTKTAISLQERLADDITTRRFAYALKSVCPALVEDGLVVYNQAVRPDDHINVDFEINLELVDILNIVATTSKYLAELTKQAESAEPAASNGFKKPVPKSFASSRRR
jgi:hypothetical protein